MSQLSNLDSTSANAIAVGRNGSTNPQFQVDCSTSSAAAGLKVTGKAAAAGTDVAVISSGTNEDLRIDAKGSGTITLGNTSTGGVALKRPTVVTGATSAALAVGANGATNPVLQVDAATASVATGLKVTGAAAASGLAIAAISSGTNENVTLDAKGSGTLTLNGTATGNIVLGRAATGVSLAATGAVTSSGTAGVGYASGAGGTVTQGTNRTTGVTLNKTTGAITLVSAAGSATPASFTVTNSTVAATDVIVLNQKSGTDKLVLLVTAVAAGSFQITFYTTGGTTTEQPVINFAVIKGVAA